MFSKKYIFSLAMVVGAFISSQAIAEVVVIVNPANGSSLDASTLKRIFLGKTDSFPGGSKLLLGELDKGAERKSLADFVGKSESKLKAHWSKLVFTGKAQAPKKFQSGDELKKWVAANKNAIGFVDSSIVDDSVKVAGKL